MFCCADNLGVDWSFQTLFGRTIERPCPVAESSRVLITLPTNGFYSIRPEPPLVAEGIARYDTKKGTADNPASMALSLTPSVLVDAPLDVSVQWAKEFQFRTCHTCLRRALLRMIIQGWFPMRP